RRIILFCIFIFSQCLIWFNQVFLAIGDVHDAIETSLMLLKFYLFFIFFDGISFLIKKRLLSDSFLYRTFSFLIFIYSFAIVIGPFLNSDVFRYYSTERWGFKGIVISGNEASALIIVSYAWALL